MNEFYENDKLWQKIIKLEEENIKLKARIAELESELNLLRLINLDRLTMLENDE